MDYDSDINSSGRQTLREATIEAEEAERTSASPPRKRPKRKAAKAAAAQSAIPFQTGGAFDSQVHSQEFVEVFYQKAGESMHVVQRPDAGRSMHAGALSSIQFLLDSLGGWRSESVKRSDSGSPEPPHYPPHLRTDRDLHRAMEAEKTRDELLAELEMTNDELGITQAKLETTQAELETTQAELETTQAELEITKCALRSARADAEAASSAVEKAAKYISNARNAFSNARNGG
ncbi:hypothetical protein MSAN_01132100 [Mycena sanguinolenta]|uniref:Uncharacterized protein n=1 Tax=Mycena sanguinolenta TaxID=230812 RepID=A0A8H6YL46_9AGAR|nr:hypothetical protein MSAN_01132100 [Mycena sanguinolenta]